MNMGTTAILSDGDVKRDPWGQQAKYARGAAWACFALIALASLGAVSRSLALKSHHLRLPGFLTLQAALRAILYRPLLSPRTSLKLRKSLNVRLPALGATLLMCVFMTAFSVWAFVVQPYYRLDRSYGSPPLGLRAGMMSVGLLPFVYALSSKVNFIGLVTQTSHERLQVYHQWGARFVLFLATVHTIPFIYQPLKNGGTAYLREMFYSDSINTTGVVAFVCLFILVFSSFRFMRERWYELWVAQHIIIAIVFLVYMFIHCQNLLTSWRYLWGGAAMYALSLFLRIARILQQSNFLLVSYAEVEALPEGLTKLTIPTLARWRPGQHIFVRFPSLEAWTNHPFTIVSQPSKDPHAAVSHVVLMAQAHAGFTQKIHARASRHQNDNSSESKVDSTPGNPLILPVIIDGPYGSDASVANYDHVLLVAGGSGATFIISSLLDLVCRWRDGTAKTKTAEVVWSVRKEARFDWMTEQLDVASKLAPPGCLRVTLHVTDSNSSREFEVTPSSNSTSVRIPALPRTSSGEQSISEEDKESLATSSSSAYPGTIHRSSRADVPHLVSEFAQRFSSSASRENAAVEVEKGARSNAYCRQAQNLAILVCGPTSMTEDAAQACAEAQVDIVRGRIAEVASLRLISERFGW